MEFTGPVIFLTAFFTMWISQACKMISMSIERGKFYPEGMLELAGMPSSHTATVTSIALGIYFAEGFSPLFAFALISLVYVMDEVMHINFEIGDHSRIINRVMKVFKKLGPHRPTKGRKSVEPFREAWGHNVPEVFMGFILGLLTTSIVSLI